MSRIVEVNRCMFYVKSNLNYHKLYKYHNMGLLLSMRFDNDESYMIIRNFVKDWVKYEKSCSRTNP